MYILFISCNVKTFITTEELGRYDNRNLQKRYLANTKPYCGYLSI